MTPLPAVPKVLRVALSGQLQDLDQWLSRFYIQYTGTPPVNTDLATFNNALITAWHSDISPLQSLSANMTLVDTIDLSSSSSAVAATTTSQTGTRSGIELPDQIAVVTSYKIARRYRGGHARGYWPLGVAADEADSGHWGSTFLTNVASGFGSFFTAVFAAGWAGAGTLSHVSVSYFSGFTVVINPITGRARNVPTLRGTPLIDPVTSLVVQPRYGTQRRREAFID